MKQGLLCVSFGTAAPAGEQDLRALEEALHQAAPGLPFFRAYTSDNIRARLAREGRPVDSLPQALERMAAAGVRQAVVQPLLLLAGREYQALLAAAEPFRPRFDRLAVGSPLLSDQADVQALAGALCAAWPCPPGQRVVLMGHGSAGDNGAYIALQRALESQGRWNMLVGTMRGEPGIDAILSRLECEKPARLLLAPLLLTGGGHTLRDMAGAGDTSWKSRLVAAGFEVKCSLRGIGALAPVQQLYRQRLTGLLQTLENTGGNT